FRPEGAGPPRQAPAGGGARGRRTPVLSAGRRSRRRVGRRRGRPQAPRPAARIEISLKQGRIGDSFSGGSNQKNGGSLASLESGCGLREAVRSCPTRRSETPW